MQQLSRSDCEKLLAVVAELYSVRDPDSLPHVFLKALRGVIQHEFAGCHLIEPRRRLIAAVYEPERTPAPAEHKDFWRLTHQHPLMPVIFTQPSQAWKLSDVMSRQAFRATEFYNVLYRPLQVDCELAAALPEGDASQTYCLISLFRSGHDFNERDRTILNMLLPHVAHARRRTRNGGARTAAGSPDGQLLSDLSLFCAWTRNKGDWRLTDRECQVLFWLCQGKTNSEIGRILGIAERTAETHALHIYPKMGVENRYTAIATINRLAASERIAL